MHMRSRDRQRPSHLAHLPGVHDAHDRRWAGVLGNERLTALVSTVLLVLLAMELLTSAYLRIWLPAHTFVGVLLAGPLLVKLGSTGWRFVHYYMRAPAYVRRGPPLLVLRVLGPLLLVATVVMVGSGIAVVIVGPLQLLLLLHVFSALIWLPVFALHTVAHLRDVPQRLADDWTNRPGAGPQAARWLRLGGNLGALLLGMMAAILLFPAAAPLFAWSQAHVIGSGPFIVGIVAALLVLVVARPWRLKADQGSGE